MEKKIRMADIAQVLGVSVVSVSKALSGKEGVGEEMRRKIIATAEEMGYVPLRTKPRDKQSTQSGNIGIVVADLYFADNTFYSSLYRQVLVACRHLGYSALMEPVTREAEQNCVLPTMVSEGKVDGLIFMGEIDRNYLKTLAESGLPYMLLDFYDEDLDVASVTGDNVAGGYRLTRHLIRTGRRDVGFVGSIHATSSIMDRFLGYSKALLKERIPLRMDWVLEDRDEEGKYIPLQLPRRMPRAFVCSCDGIAFNLVVRLKQEGYRVPEDVAVVGYDDFYYSQLCDPQLTTYRVNIEEMAKTVVEQLVLKIRGEHVSCRNTIINGRFIKRAST